MSRLAITGATLVPTDGSPAVPDGTVLVEDGRISAAGPAASVRVPPDAERIDAPGAFVMPGLVDAHVHFFQSGGLYTRPDILDLRDKVPYREREVEDLRRRLPETFARYLKAGVTSAADCGGPFWNFEVRDLASRTGLAPRIAAAGPLVSTWDPVQLRTEDPPILKAESPEHAREMVRKQAPFRPDYLKIWYIVGADGDPRPGLPVVSAALDEAKRLGLRTAVHATQLETARLAVEQGADILVHSVDDADVDEAFVELLLRKGTLYVTTLMVSERYRKTFGCCLHLTPEEHRGADPATVGTLFDLRRFPDRLGEKAKARLKAFGTEVSPAALRNLKRLRDAGVKVAAGTDAGNIGTPHGPALAREFELMALAGLSPMEILHDATVGGGRMMGIEGLGTMKPGAPADLLVLDADPRLDVRAPFRARRVVKAGKAFVPADLLPPTPVDLAQRQLNAYNAHDLVPFLECYGEDVVVSRLPSGEVLMQGLPAMEARYGKLFASAPELHCRLADRIEMGEFVVDREDLAGMPPGGPSDATAVYQVRDGRIRRVWFLRS